MPGPDLNRWQRIETLCAVLLTGALSLGHIYLLLNRGPLWRDEISSLTLATQPSWQQFWAALALDPFPGFFFVLLRAWHALAGAADFNLRVLGCLIGIGLLIAAWVNARLLRRTSPLLLLVLFGLCPTLIIWGDSLRAYGSGIFWMILAFPLFWRVVATPTPVTLLAATFTAVLAVQTLYTNSVLIFACGSAAALTAALQRQWRRALLPLAIGGMAALSLLPYLRLFGELNDWAALGRIDFSLVNSLWMMGQALLGRGHFLFWLWVALGALAIGLAVFVFVRRGTPAQLLYALVCALIALVGTLGFFRIVGWGTNPWYYLPMLAIAAAAIDLILDRPYLPERWWPARPAIAVAATLLLGPTVARSLETRATNLDVIAAFVGNHAQPSDLVVVWPASDGITFQRYLRRDLNWLTIPPVPHLPAWPGDDVMAPYREKDLLQPILGRIDETLRAGDKVWVASTFPLRPFPGGTPPPILPFDPAKPRSLGYFLRGWGFLLVDHLQKHAETAARLEIPLDQPISPYERSTVTVFTGFRPAP